MGDTYDKYYDTRPEELYRDFDKAVDVFWGNQEYQSILYDLWDGLGEKELFDIFKPLFPHYSLQYESICMLTATSISKLPDDKDRDAEQKTLLNLQQDLIDNLQQKLCEHVLAVKSGETRQKVLMLFRNTEIYQDLINTHVHKFKLIE